jgi:hypothetical protein
MSFYARPLSSQKEEADGSKRGDPSDSVIPGAVGGVVLCVVINLAAKPVAEQAGGGEVFTNPLKDASRRSQPTRSKPLLRKEEAPSAKRR